MYVGLNLTNRSHLVGGNKYLKLVHNMFRKVNKSQNDKQFLTYDELLNQLNYSSAITCIRLLKIENLYTFAVHKVNILAQDRQMYKSQTDLRINAVTFSSK